MKSLKIQCLSASILLAWGSAAFAGPFDGLLDALKIKPSEEAKQIETEATSGLAKTGNAVVDLTKVLSRPMTANELFAQQGMYSTINLAMKMSAQAKNNSNVAIDVFAAFKRDTGAMLRLASRLTASYLSYTALDSMMSSISGNPKIMNEVVIDVPQVAAFGHLQLQEDTMGVARFLAAMKASNLLVKESDKALEAAKGRYAEVMKLRDEKAKALGPAALLVNATAQLSDEQLQSMQAEDLTYLRQFVGKSLDQALKDPQANRIINRELQRRYPGEYKEIELAEQEVAAHYSEYAKTSVGVLSMLGFAAVFLNNVVDMSSQSRAHQVLLVPMVNDGVGELVGIVKNVVSSLGRNDDLIEGTFTITTADGKSVTGLPASKVIKALTDAQLISFRKNLIGMSGSSYLSKLDDRSPIFAADVLDRLVDKDTRGQFVTHVLARESSDNFSFKESFVQIKSAEQPFRLPDPRMKKRIYEEDLTALAAGKQLQPKEESAPLTPSSPEVVEQVFGKVQEVVRNEVTSLTNQDLRRIMMVHGAEALNIDGTLVRMEQPGLQGLADRREMAEAALAQARQDIGKKPSPVPADFQPAGMDRANTKPASKPSGKKKI